MKQCKKCPWKKSINPYDIKNYDRGMHENLKNTIGSGFEWSGRSMSCHEYHEGDENFCVGWLANQLGPGNNLTLRLKMRGRDLSKYKLDGEQHLRFEDTLPVKFEWGKNERSK